MTVLAGATLAGLVVFALLAVVERARARAAEAAATVLLERARRRSRKHRARLAEILAAAPRPAVMLERPEPLSSPSSPPR